MRTYGVAPISALVLVDWQRGLSGLLEICNWKLTILVLPKREHDLVEDLHQVSQRTTESLRGKYKPLRTDYRQSRAC